MTQLDNKEYEAEVIECLEPSNEDRLLLILQGELHIRIGSWEETLDTGNVVLLSSGERAIVRNNQDKKYRFVVISFVAVRGRTSDELLLPIADLLGRKSHLSLHELSHYIEGITSYKSSGNCSYDEVLQRQQYFLSLVLDLRKQQNQYQQQVVREHDPVQLVEQSVRDLQKVFHTDISVQGLADAIQMPRWQYLRLFKLLTGSKPNEYITRLRMEEAKKLLCVAGIRIWEVAHQVGYVDEQYFSRRFKQVVGVFPTAYARMHSQNLQVTDWRGVPQVIPTKPKRIIYDDASTLGDLLVLGIAPVGANLRNLSCTLSTELKFVEEIGFPVDPEKVRELQPDLVLLSRYGYEKSARVASIAPTLGLNEYAPLHQRLLKLGEVTGLKDQAKTWLQSYERQCEQVWDRLQGRKDSNESAVVLYYRNANEMYLMDRNRGFNRLLYHPLGFRLDERIRRMRHSRSSYYLTVKPDQLIHFAEEHRIFILYDESLDEAYVHSQLCKMPNWEALRAVQTGHVRFIPGTVNYDDAYNSQQLLEQFANLW